MTTFLIQTINGKIKHDFSFHLLEAIDYNNWFTGNNNYDYEVEDIEDMGYLLTRVKNYVPIGTVEFVREFLEEYKNITNVKPINIPIELMQYKYLKRNYIPTTKGSSLKGKYDCNIDIFVKSNDKIKGFISVISSDQISKLLNDNENYFVSEVVDITSEWRAFIYHGRLVGLHNYNGDFDKFPNVDIILDMVRDYKYCPPAYTLDVGINEDIGTFIIEVHNFFGCGLYGFADYSILPNMFVESYNYMLKNSQ